MRVAQEELEDLAIEHSPSQPVGITTLFVLPGSAAALAAALQEKNWEVAAS